MKRRDFLKLSGLSGGSAALGLLTGTKTLAATAKFRLKKKVSESSTICCYCSVGCGAIVSVYEDGAVKVEGDPDHPVNRGALCPKGLAMSQVHQVGGKLNASRLTQPLYRAPGAAKWEEKSLEWMIDAIAKRVKKTRDESWNAPASRTEAMASLGGGELDNEECYLLSKMNRALGLVYLEHCARL